MRKSEIGSRKSVFGRTPSKALGRKSMATGLSSARKGPDSRQSSGLGVRYSMGGKQSLGGSTVKTNKKMHTNRDKRDLNDKGYVRITCLLQYVIVCFRRQRELCSDLNDCLLTTMFGNAYATKDLMNMSTSTYYAIFSHLVSQVLGKRYAEMHLTSSRDGGAASIISTMTLLNYKFTLQKSAFTNFSLTSRPIAFGVLDFLLRLIEIQADDEDCEDDEDVCIKDEDDFLLFEAGYSKLRSEKEEGVPEEAVYEQIAKDYEDFKMQDYEGQEDNVNAILKDFTEKRGQFDEAVELRTESENELAEEKRALAAVEKYLHFQGQKLDFLDKQIPNLEQVISEKQESKKHVMNEISELNKEIGDKDTAIDLKKKLEKIQIDSRRYEEEKMNYERVFNDAQVTYTKIKQKLDEDIQAWLHIYFIT